MDIFLKKSMREMCIKLVYDLRNIRYVPCLHTLMQTQEGVWENSKVCFVKPSRRRGFTQRLLSSPKLPILFASSLRCIRTKPRYSTIPGFSSDAAQASLHQAM